MSGRRSTRIRSGKCRTPMTWKLWRHITGLCSAGPAYELAVMRYRWSVDVVAREGRKERLGQLIDYDALAAAREMAREDHLIAMRELYPGYKIGRCVPRDSGRCFQQPIEGNK